MSQVIRTYFVVLFLILFVIGGCTYWFHLFDPSVSVLGKDGTLFSLATGLVTFFFGSSVVFGMLQWFFDKKEQRKTVFLDNFNKSYNTVYDALNKPKEHSEELRINSVWPLKIQNNTLDLRIFWWEWWVIAKRDTYKILSQHIFDLVNFLFINEDLIKFGKLEQYIGLKLYLLGNIRFYYYYFLVEHILRWSVDHNILYTEWIGHTIVVSNSKDMERLSFFISALQFIDTMTELTDAENKQ